MADGAGLTDNGTGEQNGEAASVFAPHNWHRHVVASSEHNSITYAHEHPDGADEHSHTTEQHAGAIGEPGEVKGPSVEQWGEEHAHPPDPDPVTEGQTTEVRGPDPDQHPPG